MHMYCVTLAALKNARGMQFFLGGGGHMPTVPPPPPPGSYAYDMYLIISHVQVQRRTHGIRMFVRFYVCV